MNSLLRNKRGRIHFAMSQMVNGEFYQWLTIKPRMYEYHQHRRWLAGYLGSKNRQIGGIDSFGAVG